MFMVFLPRRSLFALVLPLAAALPAQGDENDVINLRASASMLRDDNLFRVPNSGRPQAETITTTIAGVDFGKKISQQRLVGHVTYVDNRYSANSYLDAGNLNYDGKWLWGVGNHLKGELGAARSVIQNSFIDFPGLRERNLRTTETQNFSLDYAFHPSWHVVGGLTHLMVENDKPLPAQSDYEANGASAGLRYTPVSGNWLGVQTRRTEGRYTRRPFSLANQFDNEFTETGLEFAGSWQVTGHSAFAGRAEFVRREHPHFQSRDFSGWAGQAGYTYQYSEKTALTATYVRTVNAFQDTASSYFTSDEVVLGSRWDATAKVVVSTRLGIAHRQYLGAIVATPKREDDIFRAGADVLYKAYRWLDLRAGVNFESRDSTGSGLDFTDRQLLLSALARF